MKNDPVFKLRESCSRAIHAALNGKKRGKTFTKYIGYSILELKNHIEKQFEPWMTWNNWGIYNSSNWKDNDPATWTWQLDHIISHSTFQYTSMEDQSFKDCWALSNLRPLSAKQNILDGNRRLVI